MRGWLIPIAMVIGCGDNQVGDDEHLLGGATTVEDRTELAYTHPLANLDEAGRARFEAGRGPFDFHWEVPQLGPQFNNDACVGCHAQNGRGLAQIGQEFIDVNGQHVSQALVRCSVSDGTPGVPGGPVPSPDFGLQLQDHATVGLPEVFVEVSYVEREVFYADGGSEMLREPRLAITQPNQAPLPPLLISFRQAPPVFGLGLLDAIPAADLVAAADPDDADGDGISGRTNQVWEAVTQTTQPGRFGHKANEPDLANQAAGAFANDIGLSNRLFHDTDQLDVANEQLDDTVFFVSTIAVPAKGPSTTSSLHGDALFDSFGCASCHVRTQVTGDHPIAALANQTIHPFTDLLLHDVGDDLTDARPDFLAIGREWRTPPLWGIGLAQLVAPGATFLHDGRARTFAEAILWHGGEAKPASEAFRTAPAADRQALIDFLGTL